MIVLNRAFFQFYRFKELEGEGKKKNRRNFSGLETKWDGGGGKGRNTGRRLSRTMDLGSDRRMLKARGGRVVNNQWPVSASSVEVLLRGSLTSRISNKQVTSCLYTREAYVFCNKMKLNKHLVNNNYYYYSCHYREGYGRVVAVVVKWTRF